MSHKKKGVVFAASMASGMPDYTKRRPPIGKSAQDVDVVVTNNGHLQNGELPPSKRKPRTVKRRRRKTKFLL